MENEGGQTRVHKQASIPTNYRFCELTTEFNKIVLPFCVRQINGFHRFLLYYETGSFYLLLDFSIKEEI